MRGEGSIVFARQNLDSRSAVDSIVSFNVLIRAVAPAKLLGGCLVMDAAENVIAAIPALV
jgi:hypothetical protein